MPGWVDAGFSEYSGRMPQECRLELKEIPLSRYRRSGDVTRSVRDEGDRMLRAVGPSDMLVALDMRGESPDTPALANRLDHWMQEGRDISLLVGGPDGLDPRCLEQARFSWSLSPLTLPHGLVRILVAEQLYRAWTILRGHPYHRQ